MISVIIPVFNGEKTIRQAIMSAVCHQSDVYREIIVVDDGSTDRTPEILQGLQTEWQTEVPIRIFWQENAGPGAARNVALKKAQGDFIVFLDADDYLAPMALGRMFTKMLEHHTKACVAGTRQLVGKIPISNSIECWHRLDREVVYVWHERNFLVEITPGVRAKMFKREVLDGLVFPIKTKWEDLAFIPAALAKAERIAVLNEPVYNYRIHLNTTVKDFLFQCKVEDVLTSMNALKHNLQKAGIDDPQMEVYYRSMLTLHTVFRM